MMQILDLAYKEFNAAIGICFSKHRLKTNVVSLTKEISKEMYLLKLVRTPGSYVKWGGERLMRNKIYHLLSLHLCNPRSDKRGEEEKI